MLSVCSLVYFRDQLSLFFLPQSGVALAGDEELRQPQRPLRVPPPVRAGQRGELLPAHGQGGPQRQPAGGGKGRDGGEEVSPRAMIFSSISGGSARRFCDARSIARAAKIKKPRPLTSFIVACAAS